MELKKLYRSAVWVIAINSKLEYRNSKSFDQPFDRPTVLSKVEGSTTLSEVEGQIPNSNITMAEITGLTTLYDL